MRRVAVLMGLAVALPSCAWRATEAPAAPAVTATLANDPWRLRLELDSAPGRAPQARLAEGTVAPDVARYELDLTPLIGRSLPPTAAFSIIKHTDVAGGISFEIALGDPASDHDKLLLRGRPARAGATDSIVGTWEEQAYCCGAAGRFMLWRSTR